MPIDSLIYMVPSLSVRTAMALLRLRKSILFASRDLFVDHLRQEYTKSNLKCLHFNKVSKVLSVN